jgi:hypothetical protein
MCIRCTDYHDAFGGISKRWFITIDQQATDREPQQRSDDEQVAPKESGAALFRR